MFTESQYQPQSTEYFEEMEMEIASTEFEPANMSLLVPYESDVPISSDPVDPNYEEFLADVWVGIILTLMVLSCVCCMCSCLLYHKFQQWKRSVIQARNAATLESGSPETELPSYTVASGLPSYDEALEQLKKVKEQRGSGTKNETWVPRTPPTPVHTLSVRELFSFYRSTETEPTNGTTATKPAT